MSLHFNLSEHMNSRKSSPSSYFLCVTVDYKYKLGASHHLTKELHERIESLKCQVSSKVRHSEPAPEGGVLATLVGWGRALSAMLGWRSGASATKDGNALPCKECPLETDDTKE